MRLSFYRGKLQAVSLAPEFFMFVRVVCLAAMLAVSGAALADGAISALEAVRQSIERPHTPLEAQWIEMDVCGAGEDGAHGFLNSVRDYRSRDSLNVELLPTVRARLEQRLGGDPIAVLRGQRIAVFGPVRQVQINLYDGGVPTGRYYFQTQMRLASASHLEPLVSDTGEPLPARCGTLIV